MWSKGEMKAVLDARALLRRGASGKAEAAALLYARAQGWTEEADVDVAATEAELNALLDDMDPDEWEGLRSAAARIGDATFRGLVSYAVKRIGDRNAEDLASLSTASRDSRRDDRDLS